jgi:membrane glycosyltransferase
MALAESIAAPGPTHSVVRRRGRNRQLWVFLGLTVILTAALVLAVAGAISGPKPIVGLTLALVTLSALWISGGAATALLGLVQPRQSRRSVFEEARPQGSTAMLVTLCGEPAGPLACYLADLRRGLDRLGLDGAVRIFVLSDTSGADRIAAEEAALAPLIAAGTVTYRRRSVNTGRKPGNIADWLHRWGDAYTHMMVLDADSRMSAGRIRALIHRIEASPQTGLVQAGMRLVPAQSRFGHHQRCASRLLSPNFGRGFAAWSGAAGNYWGHNAILRVAAFRSAAALPSPSGPPPFGGPPLSHDFIEAAWIRRAGWAVELDPDSEGSAEDGPQTLEEFHRRDRRWCQGNLQHMRYLAEPGLDPVSRLHLASGIMGYLAAPIWLMLVGLFASGVITVAGALPLIVVGVVLLLPKVCAVALMLRPARTWARRRVVLRAAAGELALSTLLAPLVMVRQTASVLSVLAGRDCGWKSGRGVGMQMPRGLPEAAAGLALMALMILGASTAAWWALPVALPLMLAPLILRAMDAGA